MRRKNLTLLLLKARDEGLTLQVDGDDLAVSPGGRISSELRKELVENKAELVELLRWDDGRACDLFRDALAYLAAEYIEAELPAILPDRLDGPEDAIDEAYAASDMFALRIAVREWVAAGIEMFGVRQGDRGAA